MSYNSVSDAAKNSGPKTMRVLAVSDIVEQQLYNESIKDWLSSVDLIISCGDLPPQYLDYLVSSLNVPLAHVVGNHCYVPHDPITNRCCSEEYLGAFNLNGRVAEHNGLVLAGAEGCPVYNGGPHQYNEQQYALILLKLVPYLLREKLRSGRYLDVLVTHAPPRGIHDNQDIAHKGFESLVGFIERFKPTLMLHGHTHRYDPRLPTFSRYKGTDIVNVYGHAVIDLARDSQRAGWKLAAPVVN